MRHSPDEYAIRRKLRRGRRRFPHCRIVLREMRHTRVVFTDRQRHLTPPGDDRPALIVPRLDRRRIYVSRAWFRRVSTYDHGSGDVAHANIWLRWLAASLAREEQRLIDENATLIDATGGAA